MDASKLEARLRAVYTKKGAELSGLAVSIFANGEDERDFCFGRRYIDPVDPERDLPVDADTKFRIASISKPVTTIGAMLLVERGLFDLDRDISDYLGFPFRNPHFPHDPITAAMLLSHTSTVRDAGGYVLPLPHKLEDFVLRGIEGAGRLAWASPIDGRDLRPGRYFCYANLNFGILATAMERASGERFDLYMRDHVMRPLGIDAAYNVLHLSDAGFHNLAALYRKAGDDGAWRPDGPWLPQVDDYRGLRPAVACRLAPGTGAEALDSYEPGSNGTIFSPQGGLRVSLRDLSKIARLLMNGGEVDGLRLLSRWSVERMMTTAWVYDPIRRNGELYTGLTREAGLGLARTTASRDEQGGDRLLPGGGPELWGHHADAYGLLGGMAFDPLEGYGFIYIIGGTARPPESLRGRYSSWFIWEEEIQAALLEESGRSGESLNASAPSVSRRAPGPNRGAIEGEDGSYRTGLWLWRGERGELGGFSLAGLSAGDEALVFDPANAEARGGELVAEATSPELLPDFPAAEIIPSWNADTPEGSRLDVLVRARIGNEWTGWYALGEWCSVNSRYTRRSIEGQADDTAEVKTDTLVFAEPAEAVQVKLRFVVAVERLAGMAGGPPSLRGLALAYSSPKALAPTGSREAGDAAAWGRVIEGVPPFSQMVYPDGGRTWCSPTCVAMVLAFWEGGGEAAESCVRQAVSGVYDETWQGCGNWSFNAAYAGTRGYSALVARFPSLARLEPFIAAGIPVAMSVAWNEEEGKSLAGAPIPRSAGHLTLLVGFDEKGDPVMNEPAARDPSTVRRTYRRAELETRWLEASGGTAYLIVPRGRLLPGWP